MIIVAASADGRKTCGAVHTDCRVIVAHLEMDSVHAFFAASVQEVIEKKTPNSPPLLARKHSD